MTSARSTSLVERAEYCRLAGRKAERAASFSDAIAHGEKRVACLEKLPGTEDVQRQIVDARTALGLYYVQMMHHVEAKEVVAPIVDLALERGYKRRVSQIYSIMGCYNYLVEEDFPKAFGYLEDALKIAEELGDILSLAFANFWLGHALALSCKYERALYHLEKSLEINVAANTLWGISMAKSNISVFVYDLQGRIDLGYGTSDEALQIAEESGDIFSKALAYIYHGYSCYCKGFLEEAEEHLLKGIDFCESINLLSHVSLGHLFLGDTCFEMGEYKKSQSCLKRAISGHEQHRLLPSLANLCKIALARAKVINNEMDINLNEIFKWHDDNRVEMFNGWMSRYIVEILLNIDDKHMSEAKGWIKKAIEADKRNGMMLHLAKNHALYADLFKRKGNTPKAKENLSKAIDIFKECGADGWVTRTEEALAAI